MGLLNYLILGILYLASCKPIEKGKKSTPNKESDQKQTVFMLTSSEPVDGTLLNFSKLNTDNAVLGEVNLLKLSLQEDPRADYYEFSICTRDKSQCMPSKMSPESFVFEPFYYPNAPAGDLIVEVRACVREYNAISIDKMCNPWESVEFQQKENKESQALTLIKKIYELESYVIDDVSALRELYVKYGSYFPEPQTEEEKELRAAIGNMKAIGEDSLSHLLLTDKFLETYASLAAREASNSSEQTGLFLDDVAQEKKLKPLPNGGVLQKSNVETTNLFALSLATLRSINAVISHERQLNTELDKIKCYQTLKKITRESPELRNLIEENPRTVIAKAQVHVEILDAASRGFTGVKLLQWNKLQKQLKSFQALEAQITRNERGPLTDTEKAQYKDIQEKIQAMDIEAKKNMPSAPSPSLEANKQIAEVKAPNVDAPHTQKKPGPAPIVEAGKTGSAPEIRRTRLSSKIGILTSLLSPAILKSLNLSENNTGAPIEDVKSAIDQLYLQIINDRLELAKLQEALGNELLKK